MAVGATGAGVVALVGVAVGADGPSAPGVAVGVSVLAGTTVKGTGVGEGCSTGGVVSQVRSGSSVVFDTT